MVHLVGVFSVGTTLPLCFLLFVFSEASLLSDLPRLNLQNGDSESSDLGSYNCFDCTGSKGNRSCSFNTEEDGLRAYAQGAGLYSGLGILACFMILLGSLIYIIYALIKCCCKCCCSRPKEKRVGVRIVSTISFSLCLLSILICFFLSTYLGNYAITENTSSNEDYNAANSLYGFQNVIKTFEPSATQSGLSSTSDVLTPAIVATNRTLNDALSINDMIEAFQILNVTIPKLPDPHVAIDSLNETKFIVHNSSGYLGDIIDNLKDVDDLVDDISIEIEILQNNTDILYELNSEVSALISSLESGIDEVEAMTEELVGEIVESNKDLQDVKRMEDGGKMPNTDVFESASSGSSGSTSRLLSGSLDGDVAEIEELNGKLAAIDANMSALPNFTDTADRLVFLNDTINSIVAPSGLLSNITDLINRVERISKKPLPVLYDVTHAITVFDTAFDGLEDEMSDTIRILKIILPLIESLLPQFGVLKEQVVAMYHTEDLLPIIGIMVDQIEGVNETLIELPDELNDILDTIQDANETIQDFLYNGTLADILDQLDEANSTVVDALDDADSELQNLEDFQDVLTDSRNNYNISSINDTVIEAIGKLSDVNLNSTRDSLIKFKDSLDNIQLSESFVKKFYSLQKRMNNLLSIFDRAIGPSGDYVLLAQGYCTDHADVYCSDDSDCASSGSTCNSASKGTYRCSSPIGNVSCTQDSTCSDVVSTSYCLVDDTRATTLHGLLLAFGDSSDDIGVSDTLSQFDRAIGDGIDVDFDTARDMLSNGTSGLDAFNISEISILLNDVQDGIYDLDTESVTSQLESTKSSIDDVDFDDFIDQIDGNLDLYDRVSDTSFAEKWIDAFKAFRSFMFNDGSLKLYVSNLRHQVLVDILKTRGPVAAYNHIGKQVDLALNDLRQNQSAIDIKENKEPFATKYEDKYEILERAGASRYPMTRFAENDRHGSIYYLFALSDNLTIGNIKTVPYDYALARGIFANSEGYRYEDRGAADDDDNNGDEKTVFCFTFSCFEHTMNVINTAPMSDVYDEIFPKSYGDDDDGGSSSVAIDYSREEVMLLLWVPVLILLLIGVVSLIFAFIPSCHKMHKGCNCCFLSCALLMLPFIFLLSSAFLFFAIVGEDSCNSGTSIGENYIASYGNDFCEQKLKGKGTLAECTFNWTLPEVFGDDEKITISLNVLDTYNALFQGQCDLEVDPFSKVANDLAEQVRSLPLKATQKALTESDYKLRPPLELIINNTAVNYGNVMYDLIAETHFDGANKVMSCESMSLIYGDVEDTACEGVVLPAAWMIATWYFVGWAICCCGVPSSCMRLTKTSANVADGHDVEEDESEDDEVGSQGSYDSADVELVKTNHGADEENDDNDDNDEPGVEVRQSAEYSVLDMDEEVPHGHIGSRQVGIERVSGDAPRNPKESGNSYIDRSSDRARHLGLGEMTPQDSRFQTSRSSGTAI